MTLQNILDTVTTHLFKQGARAFHEGSCMYRDPAGRSCAVGCLMTDEQYFPALEGQTVPSLKDAYASHKRPLPDWLTVAPVFLNRLQKIHDSYMPAANSGRETKARAMRAVASWLARLSKEYELTTPAIVLQYLPTTEAK